MVATAAAIAGILGTAVSAGSTIAGTMGRGGGNSQAQRQNDIAAAQLQDARNNDQYQKMLSVLINQRSIAGSEDEYGSSVRYDPATNTWVSALGKQPKAVQDAADLANISRNTTDLRQAQAANAAAMQRARAAEPAADTAIRNLNANKDTSAAALIGLLNQRSTDAANATFEPLRADMLRQFQRTGTAAGAPLAAMGKQQYDALRESLVDNQIKGMTNVDQMNEARRSGLEKSAAQTYALAQPQFQYPGIQQSTNKDALANIMTARAQQGGVGPAYGAGGVNTAAGQTQDAYKNLGKNTFAPSNSIQTAGKEIGSLLTNRDFTSNLESLFGKGKGGGTGYDAAAADKNAQKYNWGSYTPASGDDSF